MKAANGAAKACRIHRFGPPGVIALEDVARPVPGEGEVLVRVQAAGVGSWDARIRAGGSAPPQPLPLVLGAELAGVVAAVGRKVRGFRPGDRVFGVTNPGFTGAYADHAVARAGTIARMPARLDAVDAASVPVVAVTAWQALFDHAGLVTGQTVLIRGTGGDVGAYAVQLARHAGVRVAAAAAARKVDAVVDLAGGGTWERSFAVLKPGGILVSAVSPPDEAVAAGHGMRTRFFRVAVTSGDLERIAALIDAGALQTRVGAVLPLAEARQAHEMLEGARPRPPGRIVLRVGA